MMHRLPILLERPPFSYVVWPWITFFSRATLSPSNLVNYPRVSGNHYRNHKRYGSEPVTPRGSLSVSHFKDNDADGKDLDQHFDFTGDNGRKVDSARFCNVPQHGNINFSDSNYQRYRPLNN
jgi:hypothetical protein